MWFAFLQLHKVLQRQYRLGFIYDEGTKRFKVNPKKNYIYHWTNSQILLVWLVSISHIAAFFKSSETDEDAMEAEFEAFIMNILYFGLMVICLSCIWTVQFRRREAVWFLNQIMSLKKPEELENREMTIETLTIYSVGCVAVIMPVSLAILPFVLEDTPANEILRFYLPNAIMESKSVETILSSLYWLIYGYFAVFPCVQLIAITILVVVDSKQMVKPSYEPKLYTRFDFVVHKTKEMKENANEATEKEKLSPANDAPDEAKISSMKAVPNNPASKLKKLKMAVQATKKFPDALLVYRKVDLIFKSFQKFGFVLFPALIFTAFLLNVVSTFVCIKLNEKLPILIVGMMGVVDVIVLVNTFAVYMFAWFITIETDKFEAFWKGKPLRKVYELQLQSCRRIVIWVGSFFPLHQAIVLTHMTQVVDMTTNILLVD